MRRRLAALVAAVLLPAALWGDGKYWPEPAYPAAPKMPLQRALIVFDNGVETLVVESSFESASPSVGWVLPLPAEPTKLDAADPGMLTSLSMSLRPIVIHDLSEDCEFPRLLLWILVPAALVLIFVVNRPLCSVLLILIFLLGGGFTCVRMISCSGGRIAATGVGSALSVEVKSVQRVGNYEVSVLRAKAADALSEWLADKSLQSLDAPSAELVDDYIVRGWCFAVARLTRSVGGLATPHPISATFPVRAPVYPMKLTGLSGSNTRVDLVVIARGTASAKGFRCAASDRFQQERHTTTDIEFPPPYWARETDITIGSPDVGDMMWPDCVVTRLTADLAATQMDRDVDIGLGDVKPHRDVFYSERGRAELTQITLLWGAVALTVTSAVVFRLRRRPCIWELAGLVALTMFFVVYAWITWAQAPVIAVKAGLHTDGESNVALMIGKVAKMADRGQLHAGMGEAEFAKIPEIIRTINPFTGETVRFERSPGNISVRLVNGDTYFCVYNADGREYRMRLPPAK